MVGGSSRIPVLAERLTSMLGKAPRLVEPDLAVAKGAALRAHHLAGTPQLAALTAARADQRPPRQRGPGHPGRRPARSGSSVEDSYDPSGERSFVEHLVKANTPLPVERTREQVRHHPAEPGIGPDPGVRAGGPGPVRRRSGTTAGCWTASSPGSASCRPGRSSGSPCGSRSTGA